ncbi:unnamed protein product [Schistosoma curassoni]|uniref:Core-binding (CB) domain-containing protein n=1 Tax=Schistosoma curassoni TaxID=6186 RepID=A0A183K482_9TREM|nr:unnamed protein product [Schistosoma curassoni]
MSVKVSNSLSPFYVELAKKNLSENPAHVQAHLTAFKRWLSSCQHLTIPQGKIIIKISIRNNDNLLPIL